MGFIGMCRACLRGEGCPFQGVLWFRAKRLVFTRSVVSRWIHQGLEFLGV